MISISAPEGQVDLVVRSTDNTQHFIKIKDGNVNFTTFFIDLTWNAPSSRLSCCIQL